MKIGVYGPDGSPKIELDLTGWSREYFLASHRVLLIDGDKIIQYRPVKEPPKPEKRLSTGWLCKIDGIWTVKWSDLHSFAYGTIWSYSPLIEEQQSLPNLVDEMKVEFEHVHHFVDFETFKFELQAKLFLTENGENT